MSTATLMDLFNAVDLFPDWYWRGGGGGGGGGGGDTSIHRTPTRIILRSKQIKGSK